MYSDISENGFGYISKACNKLRNSKFTSNNREVKMQEESFNIQN